MGYCGVGGEISECALKHQGKFKRLSDKERQLLKQRSAVESIISHLKSDHRMDRRPLKGKTGAATHAVLCAAGFNMKWPPRMIARKGIRPFYEPFFSLIVALGPRVYPMDPVIIHGLRSPEVRPEMSEMNSSWMTTYEKPVLSRGIGLVDSCVLIKTCN